jgi:putative redox protein
MMEAKVVWQGNMAFQGSADTDIKIPLDAAEDVGGENSGSQPMVLIAIGLAGCTAMDVISILKKKREDITNFDVKVSLDRAQTHPKVFTKALIEYTITGHYVSEAAVTRSIELSATRYCPAQAMFNQLFPIDLKYYIYEDKGNGADELIVSGELHF